MPANPFQRTRPLTSLLVFNSVGIYVQFPILETCSPFDTFSGVGRSGNVTYTFYDENLLATDSLTRKGRLPSLGTKWLHYLMWYVTVCGGWWVCREVVSVIDQNIVGLAQKYVD